METASQSQDQPCRTIKPELEPRTRSAPPRHNSTSSTFLNTSISSPVGTFLHCSTRRRRGNPRRKFAFEKQLRHDSTLGETTYADDFTTPKTISTMTPRHRRWNRQRLHDTGDGTDNDFTTPEMEPTTTSRRRRWNQQIHDAGDGIDSDSTMPMDEPELQPADRPHEPERNTTPPDEGHLGQGRQGRRRGCDIVSPVANPSTQFLAT